MKILHLSTSDLKGGASIASYQLNKILNQQGYHSRMLVKVKESDSNNVIAIARTPLQKRWSFLMFVFERIRFLFYEKSSKYRFKYSLGWPGYNIARRKEVRDADIIHLHWINQGFISLKGLEQLLKLKKPVIWSMHDMWSFTGGCHHTNECQGFKSTCGNCPMLRISRQNDLSNKQWNRKKLIFDLATNIYFTAPSSWLHDMSGKSSLLHSKEIVTIPNIIDTGHYQPKNIAESRKRLGLDEDTRIILFGAPLIDDPNKGLEFFTQAVGNLTSEEKKDILVVLFGRIKRNKHGIFNKLDCNHLYLDYMTDPSEMPYLYSAADVTIVPSLYETFGLMVAESMACGTPVVAFDNSGPRDIIDHKSNGFLAVYKEPDSITEGIRWIFNNNGSNKISGMAREKIVRKYSENVVIGEYLKLYNRVKTD